MKNCALVIMAAGLGSRYKGGIKQMDAIGSNGEWFMDYSIYDAYQAGVRKVVFIIRTELEGLIQNHFNDKLPNDLELIFVHQDVKDLPNSFAFSNRTKPWGTGQAILCCKDVIQEPFMVVNADDYYGRTSFQIMYDYLRSNPNNFCMAGYYLKNTLSKNGSVNRGICEVDSNLKLVDIKEMYHIEEKEIIQGELKDGSISSIDGDCFCSLNLWGFPPTIFEELEIQFQKFLSNLEDIEKDEFLLPTIIQTMLHDGKIKLQVLPTNDEWFGMTYQEDKKLVQDKIKNYEKEGIYSNPLWKK